MTTLQGEELFEYLKDLEELLKKAQPQDKDPTLSEMLHTQMCELIDAEKRFLTEYHQKNGIRPMMAAPNGLPTIETLTEDLEAMSKLEEFKEIAEKYRRKTIEKRQLRYNQISMEEWHEELKKHDKKNLNSKIGFEIRETEHGIFELEAREEFYKEGYDKFCKECPVLIRDGRIRYHVVMRDRLLAGVKGKYYVPEKITSLEQLTGRDGSTEAIKIIDNGLQKHDPSKTKRIKKLEEEIQKTDGIIKDYLEKGVLYSKQLNWESRMLKTVLELEKNHTSKFRWRKSWDPNLFARYNHYYIYKKGFLDIKIARVYFHGDYSNEVDNVCLNERHRSYIEIFKKVLPEAQIHIT